MKTQNDFTCYQNKTAKDVIQFTLNNYTNISLATSFQAEGIVLIDLLSKITPVFRVFSIDTGRLPEETYECADLIMKKYNIKIEWYFPDKDKVQDLEREKGLFSFRENLKNRHECCFIRKVEPLGRALKGLDAWITGLRKEHCITRENVQKIRQDHINGGIINVNPLADWNEQMLHDYIKKNQIPYNKLYDLGYTSVGCAPCTRPVTSGEDKRAGRWWWEKPEQKECGLHNRNSDEFPILK